MEESFFYLFVNLTTITILISPQMSKSKYNLVSSLHNIRKVRLVSYLYTHTYVHGVLCKSKRAGVDELKQ